MELKELIHPLEVLEVVGNTDVEISGCLLYTSPSPRDN